MNPWFVLGFLFLSQFVSPQEVFQRGEELYREGRYEEAAEQYEALISQGVVDGALCYNLGNAYFKSGRLGLAILNYERALRQMPGDDDTKANLAFANELIVDVVQRPPMPSYVAWAVDLYHALDPDLCAALLSVSFLLGGAATAILIVGRWPQLRTPAIYTLVVVGVVTLLSASVLTAKVQSSAERVEAIVLAQALDVRSGPGESNPQLAEIHEGLKVSVLGGREGWLQIRLPNGLTGWVREADVESI
jgi:tetratricopeptide (TPR) repeat protein